MRTAVFKGGKQVPGEVEHVRSNASAGEIELTKDDLAALDAAFPRPSEKEPLQML
jgi:hypothetical protein